MKVLFINSKNAIQEGITHLPLVIAYPAAVLESEGFFVNIIDLAVENLSHEKLDEKIKGISPDIIVINSETTVLQVKNYCHALDLSKRIKKSFPEISLAMMGAHVTFRDEETLERNNHIDYIIRHEAEYVLLNLVNVLKSGSSLDEVKGLTFRKNGGIVKNENEPPISDLDSLSLPARHLFPINKYLEKDYETVVQGNRGCSNKCFFCHSSAMDRTLRFRSIDNIIEEIKEVLSFGFKSIYFADYNFGIVESRLEEFCQKVIEQNLDFNWNCNIRADIFEDKEKADRLLGLMNRAGCYRLFVGFESVSNEILKNSNKDVSSNQLYKAAQNIQDNNINLHASFLFGLPGDTEETIKATVEFAKKINPQMVSFNVLTPYPGTPLGDYPEKFGIEIPDKYWYENVNNLKKSVSGNKNLSPERLQQLAKEAYIEFLSG